MCRPDKPWDAAVTRLHYRSGEEILEDDRIIYFGDFGQVEFVASGVTGDPLRDWYVQRNRGGGLMIRTSRFGRVFVSASAIDFDLLFLSRGPNSPTA
jgi:hypothetical protein